MEKTFKQNLLDTLEKDKNELVKHCDSLNKENNNEIKKYENELKKKQLILNENKKNLESLLSISKKDYKQDKKNIKLQRKNKRIEINNNIIEVSKIRNIIDAENREIRNNNKRMEEDMDNIISHVNNYIRDVNTRDSYITKHLTISALKTKIKVTIKEYDIEKIPSNPRIGMSLGTNFKPRVFVSTNAKTKTKKVITRNETFDIHPKDNPKIRLDEISTFLGIIDPSNLTDFFYENLERYQGKQYIKNFFK